MKRHGFAAVVGAVVVVAAGAGAIMVHAGAEPAKPDPALMKEMSPEMQEMMKQYMALAEAGPEHAVLRKLEGRWTTRIKLMGGAGMPASESTGTAKGTLVHGGRYLMLESSGEMMGIPCDVTHLMGYDRFQKMHTVGIWGNTSTQMHMFTGQTDAGGSSITYTGEMNDIAGKRNVKFVMRLDGEDGYQLEAYDTLPDGTELKVLETTFTRAK